MTKNTSYKKLGNNAGELDKIDDGIWDVLVKLNKLLDININLTEIEQSALIIEARDNLIEVLERESEY